MKNRSIATALFALLTCGSALADEPLVAPAPSCGAPLCHPATTVKVTLKDQRILEVPYSEPSPVVASNGRVTIRLGEEITLAMRIENGVIQGWESVPASTDMAGKITLSLSQEHPPGVMLTVKSGLKQDLKFNLGMRMPEQEGLYKTSSCPLRAGLMLFESWPHPVVELTLASFRFLPAEASHRCE